MKLTHSLGYAQIVLDFETFTVKLTVEADHSLDFETTSKGLKAMNQVYQKRIVPFLRSRGDTYCFETGEQLEPVDDVAELMHEVQVNMDDESSEADADGAIQNLTATLRKRLIRALEHESVSLHTVVYYLGDGGIQGVYLNPPALADLPEAKLGAFMKSKANRFGAWLGKDCRSKARWSLEEHPLSAGLEKWGEPDNLYDNVVQGALYLACAHFEAAPGLPVHIKVLPNFRAFFVFHDSENDVDPDSRALASRHVSGAAGKFFDKWSK